MALRVVSCDRQTLTLVGVRAILEAEDDVEVVRETSSARHAINMAREHRPDIVVLGLPLADLDPVTTVRQLLLGRPDGRPGVIVMTTPMHEGSLLDALRAGARGVVSKESSPSELVHAVRAVAAGEAVLTATMTRHLLNWAMRVPVATADREAAVELLSDRERTVLELVSSGLSDSEVAEALHVSTATVRSHMHHIISKLGLRGRTQVVAFAYRHGLMPVAGHEENGR